MVMVMKTTAARFSWRTTTPSPFFSAATHPHRGRTHTVTKGQGNDNVIDSILFALPNITSTVQNVTKGATDKQIQNLKMASKFIAPAMRIFMELQSGPYGLNYKDRAMLDEVGTLTNYLASTFSNSQPPENKTRDLLPDYTEMLENSTDFLTFTDVNTDADLPSTVSEPQRDSLGVKTSRTSDSSRTPASSPSTKTLESADVSERNEKQTPTLAFPHLSKTLSSFDVSPQNYKQTPTPAFISAFSKTFGSSNASPRNEKHFSTPAFPPSTKTFRSYDVSPHTEKQTPTPAFPPFRKTFRSFGVSPRIEKQTPTPAFPPFRKTFRSFGISPRIEKQTPTPAFPPTTTTFTSFDVTSQNEKQTPTPAFPPTTKTFTSYDVSSENGKQTLTPAFPPTTKTLTSVDVSPQNEKQTPTIFHSSTKTIVPRPANVKFPARRFQTSQVTRPKPTTPITGFGSFFADEEVSKGDQTTQTTQAPRTQPSEKPRASKRRYTPSRLLRQQFFGNAQSTSPSSTDASVTKYTVTPRTVNRSGRRAVLRRRRLTV